MFFYTLYNATYTTLHYTFMKYEKFQFHLYQIISQIGINQQMKLINN